MADLKKEIATTFRKKKLVERWKGFTTTRVAEREKCKKVERVLNLSKKEVCLKVWSQFTSLEKNKKQLVATFQKIRT